LAGLTTALLLAAGAMAQTALYTGRIDNSRPLRSVVVRAKSGFLKSSGDQLRVSAAGTAASARVRFLELTAGLGVTEARQLWPSNDGMSDSMRATHPGANTFIVVVPSGRTAEDLAAKLAGLPWVDYAEVDQLVALHDTPNDPLWSRQWDLANTGQPYWSVRGIAGNENDSLIERVGVSGADIRFLASYESAEPTADVLVGVIDTGLDTLHADLRERLARNPGEIPDNGVDDDNNGFVDDLFGWDFSGDSTLSPIDIIGDNDIGDDNGHGTHVAGTIAATVDNNAGIAGVCRWARIIGGKIFPNAYFSISAQAIYYVVDRGARVINMSWGGSFRSRAIVDALQYAHDRGVVLVSSMGNSGRDEVFYPSGYATTIGVGASNARDLLSRFSTFNQYVDVIAPGEDILSLRATGTDLYADIGEPGVHIIDENYLIASGTSMSSPHVAGAAAVLLSFAPGLSNERVRDILRSSADDVVDPYGDGAHLPGFDRYTGAGRINLERAIAMLPGILIEITSHARGAQLAGSDTVITGRATGRSFAGLRAQLAANHPPLATDWHFIPDEQIETGIGQFLVRLPDAETLFGPYTLRIDAGIDAVLDWPLWFGNAALASIDSPIQNDTIQLLRPIVGSAYAPRFTSYSLEAIGPLPSNEVHPISTSSAFRWQDTLAYWRTDSLANGIYDLVLAVNSQDGSTSDTVRVVVRDAFLDGFPVDLPSPAHFAVATVNLDGRGGEEIVCPTQNGLYVLQTNGQVYPGWPRATTFDVSTAPAVADLDRDGKYEIIVAGRSYMHVYAFIGEAFAGWPQAFLGGSGIFGNSMPVVGDIDGKGGLEVAAIDRHGRIKVWHADGTIFAPKGGEYFARIEIDRTLNNSLPRLAICDLDRDNRAELIAAADGIHVFDAMTADPYRDNDSSLVAGHFSVHGLVIGDYNGDSRFDIAYVAVESGTDRFKLHVIDADGSDLPGWPREIPQPVNLYLLYSLSVGDIDGDQIPELFFAPYSLGEGYLYAFHGNGAPVGSDSTNGLLAALPGSISAVTIVTIDRDDAPEIVIRVGELISGPDRIFALKADGQLVPGYPIVFGDGSSPIMPAPVIGDLNVDGAADMTTVQSTSMSVAVWELGIPATAKGRPWPRFSGDLWNSGIAPAPYYDLIYLVRMIDMVFRGGYPLPPYEPTDLDCDGVTSMNDVIALTNYLFRSGFHPCKP
jgi:subtilisin family serine protease